MKTKTSITLTEQLIKSIDRFDKQYKNRSDFIETAVKAFIRQIELEEQNARDIGIINKNAERLNSEASDVLTYQAKL
jgi:metal-responsive CopG/Arc/MetJ family transcriptional regulator